MSYGSKVLSAGVQRTLLAQGLLILITAGIFLAYKGPTSATAVIYGGAIAMLIAALLGWRLQRAADAAGEAPEAQLQGSMQLYWGAMERFLIVGVGFAVGIAVIKLPPLPMIVAFAVAQLGFLLRIPTRLQDDKGQQPNKRGVTP
jgi:ATP synthase protein I